MSFYEKGAVRICYEETGSGFPLLVIAGGGLISTIAGLKGTSSPFNPMVLWVAGSLAGLAFFSALGWAASLPSPPRAPDAPSEVDEVPKKAQPASAAVSME